MIFSTTLWGRVSAWALDPCSQSRSRSDPVDGTSGHHALQLTVLVTLLASTFSMPVAAQTPPVLVDLFDAPRLDLGKWDPFPAAGASFTTGSGLQMALNGAAGWSQVRVFTFYQFIGDFDAQVDFDLASGWSSPFPSSDTSPALDGAVLGVYLDGQNWMTIFRSRFPNDQGFSFYSNVDLGGSPSSQFASSTVGSGSLRVIANGGRYRFLFNAGAGWVELASAPAWTHPVRLFLGAANVNAHVSFSTTLRRFRINSGATDYRPYDLPQMPLRRTGFIAGGQFINEVISRWNNNMSSWRPMSQLRVHGMSLARGCMTTVSDPDLASTPPAFWHTLGWKESYWSSREMIARLFQDAIEAGMRINACFYLSDGPADAGRQDAPATWRNLSVADTASAVEQYTYETTGYLLGQGIRAELYDIGNEILYGILNFRPGQRIDIPPGVDFTESISYLRTAVWPIEATLLTAAIRGVRRADPSGLIVLHVEIGNNSPGMEAVYAFFETMQSLGVPYDVAAPSVDCYVDSTNLSGFTSQTYFQRFETLVNRIAGLSKPVYIAECSYPAGPLAIFYPAMPEFPYSDAGQAAFLASHMRWASNNPNIIGWTWFYPEWYPDITEDPSAQAPKVSGLFSDAHTLRPAAAALNFLADPHTITITAGPSSLPNPVPSSGTATLSVTAVDSLGFALNYAWTASCPTLPSTGSFNNAAAQSPTWAAPVNVTGAQQTCTLQVTVSDGQGLSQVGSFSLGVTGPIVLQPLAAAVLPTSRSAQVGSPTTAFVTIINAGSEAARAVGITLASSIPATLEFQGTDPLTNQLTGARNAPIDIPAGLSQSFVISLTPTAALPPTDVTFTFAGSNTASVTPLTGVNTLLLSASLTPVPDVVALAATPGNTGIVNVQGENGTGAFAVAMVNVGASGSITVSTDTGSGSPPVTATLCQTDPLTGVCISPIGPSVTTQINADSTPTFGIFVTAHGPVPFDAALNRIFVRFRDDRGIVRGATSVAVRSR